ncbi:MAG: hypothetical protein PUI25_08460, partial [Spirochaetales bacterium]|nr:hypothetical protein [Spirochaetales bacterium]
IRDMLTFSGATLMLDDGEYATLLSEIGKLIEASLNKEKRDGRRERQLYILSAPVVEDNK